MAFVFTVETGLNVAGANSYVPLTYAEDYFAVDVASPVWEALSDDQKEFYLAWATRVLDQKTEWRGYINADTQALRWPRKGVTDRDYRIIDVDEIPNAVKAATCELAKWLITNDPTTGQDTDYIRRIKVDVIEIEYQEGTTQSSYPSIINAILVGIGYFRIGSRGFGRIVR